MAENQLRLILQEYIQHAVGGVLFSPWGFFSDYFQLDYAEMGVKAVVEGQSQPAVLALYGGQPAPLALPMHLLYLQPLLQQLVQQLRSLFAFAVDAEWVFDPQTQRIVLLQVRPQTSLSGAVQVLTPAILKQYALPAGEWAYTALSESLGKLSPLSFSLLQQLYADSRASLQGLGYAAQQVDFMQHCADGTVLVDAAKERQFYQLKGFGGFWQGLRLPKSKQQAQQLIRDYVATAPFDYTQLSRLFTVWLISNLQAPDTNRAVTQPLHIYELTWASDVPKPSLHYDLNNWQAINSQLRGLVWFELGKLKRNIAPQALTQAIAFCTWAEYQAQHVSQAVQRQAQLASLAIYDWAMLPTTYKLTAWQNLSVNKTVNGKAFVISQPAQFKDTLPAQSIVLAPYFDPRWVAQIPRLAAIVVQQGGRLSHAALVAREAGIPFCVVQADVMAGIQTGVQLQLNPSQQSIKQSD
jgi:phosphohistidine swiveling domain-containing protein